MIYVLIGAGALLLGYAVWKYLNRGVLLHTDDPFAVPAHDSLGMSTEWTEVTGDFEIVSNATKFEDREPKP
jgi:hypothetical protein